MHIVGGVAFQYFHGVAAQGVHYFHRPGPTLQDVGFFLLPELGQEKAYISETVFTFLFISFVLWTFHPFVLKSKKIYTVLIWCRVLAFLVACQILRIITFYSTQLPGPNYHCREGSKLATLPPPDNVLEVLIIVPQGALYGCGDLIFSSHTIFSLVFVRTYHMYGTRRFVKLCAWFLVVIQSLLIVASRKHYTVDVVVAWYVVNLVGFFLDKKLPEIPDRSDGPAAMLLPLNNDEKAEEENHKVLNENSGDYPIRKRFCVETGAEINLLAKNWKHIFWGLSFQYLHGVAAKGVHYFHRPGPTLQDIGFYLLPELGEDKAYISEIVFTFLFISFALWTFHPFVLKSKTIYTVLIWCRVLAFLVACQILRIITFYSTQLPGPNYHCQEGSKLATLPRPDNILKVLLINFPQGALYGCGDLIFSSHTIFSLVFVRTYHMHGTRRFVKLCAWLLVVIQSLLIVASRKHYTVDVVVAWYVVNLVGFFIDKKLPELPDRSDGAAATLLPLSEDERAEEENHKPLSDNSGDYPGPRTQPTDEIMEGLEKGNGLHVEAVT